MNDLRINEWMSRGEINFNFFYHKSLGIKTVEARCANAIDFFKINFTKKNEKCLFLDVTHPQKNPFALHLLAI